MSESVKFVTNGLKRFNIPFVKTNKDGIVVINKSISFHPGGQHMGKVIPAYYETKNADEIECLKNYPTYGEEFKIVSKEEVQKAKVKKAAPVVEEVEFDEEEEGSEEDLGPQIIEDVTTPQKANIRLRQLDPKLKTSDVKSMEDILKHAERLNVEFPNLKE